MSLDNKDGITVEQFVAGEIDRLQRFITAWNSCRDNEPETFAETHTELVFMQQYEVWLDEIYGAYDEGQVTANENKVENSS